MARFLAVTGRRRLRGWSEGARCRIPARSAVCALARELGLLLPILGRRGGVRSRRRTVRVREAHGADLYNRGFGRRVGAAMARCKELLGSVLLVPLLLLNTVPSELVVALVVVLIVVTE